MSGETDPLDADGVSESDIRRPGDPAPRWMAVVAVVLLLAIAVCGTLGIVASARLGKEAAKDPRVAYLEAVVGQNPDDLALRSQLAVIYQQSGYHDRALREYRRVLAEDPKDLAALYNVGVIRMTDGNEKAGEKAFREVLAIAPTHAYSAAALGFYLEREGRLDEIVEAVEPAAAAQPGIADLQYLMGVASENADDGDAAIEYYRRAAELVPNMHEARRALSRLEAQQ